MATAEKPITLRDYFDRPDIDEPTELVRGVIVPLNRPSPRHGDICARLCIELGIYLQRHDLGRVITNDSGVITERHPDTLRGPDVAYYSYQRMPKGPAPQDPNPSPPELVFEVRSPHDRWPGLLRKVAEYLGAGVEVVCVVDPASRSLRVFSADDPGTMVEEDEELTFPGLLDGFSLKVRQLFD
ncbi:hypothetical protein Pan216_50210 [Planctomycetes bacterium Pan216]|uniref:Putative restriction endonuclease domain-containing protein n=1 Tax=Kolteria novifilia TaxID=2527975 RepID=A0A518BAX7_9BACT|nr:hypothetical protein Pan216_50210 [Planctomycetes bacterium Pan216]